MKGPCLSSRELGLGAKESWGAGEGLGGNPGSCVERLREEAESVVEAAGPGGLVRGRGGCRCEGHCRGSDSRPGGHSGLGSPGKWALTGPQVPTQRKWARSSERGSSERKNLGWTCPCHWRALDGVGSRDQEGALFPIPLCRALYKCPLSQTLHFHIHSIPLSSQLCALRG